MRKFSIIFSIIFVLVFSFIFFQKNALAVAETTETDTCSSTNFSGCQNQVSCWRVGGSWDGSACTGEAGGDSGGESRRCPGFSVELSDNDTSVVVTTDCYGDSDAGFAKTVIKKDFTMGAEQTCTTIKEPVFNKQVACDDLQRADIGEDSDQNPLAYIQNAVSVLINKAIASVPLPEEQCYEPTALQCSDPFYPWQIYHSEIYTTKSTDPNNNNCVMDLSLLSESKGVVQQGQSAYCGDARTAATGITLDDQYGRSAYFEHIVTLDGSLFDRVVWEGYTMFWARRSLLRNFSADKTVIAQGQSVTISWNINNVFTTSGGSLAAWIFTGNSLCSCSGDPCSCPSDTKRIQLSSESGSMTFYPQSTTNFYLYAWGVSGEGRLYIFSNPIVVRMTNSRIDLKARNVGESTYSDGPISLGDSGLELSWTSEDVTSCSASATPSNSDWQGSVATNGTKTLSNVSAGSILTITCQTPASGEIFDKVIINSGDSHLACQSNACVSVAGAGSNECSTNSDCQTETPGVISVKARVDGKEVSLTGLNYNVVGISDFSGVAAPQEFGDAEPGIYTVIYNSGAPTGTKFVGVYPASSLTLTNDSGITFYLDFESGQTCDIEVNATKDGVSYTGDVSYRLAGPSYYDGNYASYSFSDVPTGLYYLAYVAGGPGTVSSITPANPQYCFAGNTLTFNMNFSSESASPTPTGTIGDNDPEADILCWATKDSDRCLGQVDGNNDTPSVILYNRSTDDDNDIKSCYWEVFDSNGQKIKEQSTCAPLVWGDTLGSYSADLKVTDSQGNSDSIAKSFRVIDVSELTCDFTWDPESPKATDAADFFDTSLTPAETTIKSWSWSFEDGTPEDSNLSNPADIIFSSAGEKTVTLTVKNSAGATDTCSQEVQVKSINPKWKEVIPE